MKHAKAALVGIVCLAAIGVSVGAGTAPVDSWAATTRPAGSAAGADLAKSLLDEKWVAKQLASDHEGSADVLVRVECWQGPKWDPAAGIPKAVPAGAKLMTSTEVLATFNNRFYGTTRQSDRRIELGGALRRATDGYIGCKLAYEDRDSAGVRSFSSSVMLKFGERLVISGCAEGEITTVTLEPAGK
jgi:hypothetical protein